MQKKDVEKTFRTAKQENGWRKTTNEGIKKIQQKSQTPQKMRIKFDKHFLRMNDSTLTR